MWVEVGGYGFRSHFVWLWLLLFGMVFWVCMMLFDVRAMCLGALCFLFGYVFCPRCRGIMWPEGGLTGYSYWVTACILTFNGQGPSIDKIQRTFLA